MIDLKVIDKDGSVWHIGYNAALATGLPYDRKSEGVKIGGCGMDMGFALVSSLGHALWPEGYECLGDKCPDPSHVNYRQTCKNCGHTAYWHREARREDADDSHADSSCAYGGCTCQEYIPGDPDPRGPGVHHKESDYALKHSWL